MVEMTEAANILNNATSKSLVILDDDRPGDEHLRRRVAGVGHHRISARPHRLPALFATHYHELASSPTGWRDCANYNALVHEGPDGIVFLRRIAAGSADRSYGIHVARLAGVPQGGCFSARSRCWENSRGGSAPGATRTARRRPGQGKLTASAGGQASPA